MGECKIEQDMSMTEYEKIDFIRFPKFFGKAYQVARFSRLDIRRSHLRLFYYGPTTQCKSQRSTGGVWPRKDIGRSGFEIFF